MANAIRIFCYTNRGNHCIISGSRERAKTIPLIFST